MLMAAFLCLTMVGCTDTSYAATDAQGEKLPAGLYILYQISALNEAQQHEDFDISATDIWEITLDDKDLETWINDRATELLREHVEIDRMFEEMNLSFSETDEETIDYTLNQSWTYYAETYEDLGIAKSSYQTLLENSQKYNLLFSAYYGEDGTDPVTDESLMAHFESDYAQIRSIAFSTATLDSEGNAMTDEQKAEVEQTANAYLARALEGEDMVTLINDRRLEVAQESGAETPEISQDETYLTTIQKDESNSYSGISDELTNQIFSSAEIGVPVVLSDEQGYYLVMRYPVDEDPDSFAQMRNTLLYDLKGEAFETMISEQAKNLQITLNTSALKKFKAKNLLES